MNLEKPEEDGQKLRELLSTHYKDKSKIVFESYRDDDPEIYLINSDGSNEKRLTNRIGIDDTPSFSPDGSKVIYFSAIV